MYKKINSPHTGFIKTTKLFTSVHFFLCTIHDVTLSMFGSQIENKFIMQIRVPKK